MHIPYKGTAELTPELLANRIQFTFADTTALQSYVDSGKLRMLAVTSSTRLPQLPGVQTFEEAGVQGYTPSVWYGLYAARGTPPAALERINAEVKAVLSTPETQQYFAERHYQPAWLPLADAQIRRSCRTDTGDGTHRAGATG